MTKTKNAIRLTIWTMALPIVILVIIVFVSITFLGDVNETFSEFMVNDGNCRTNKLQGTCDTIENIKLAIK